MLIVVFLYNEDYINDILAAFMEVGILNAIVISGHSISQEAALRLPIFAEFNVDIRRTRKQHSSIIIGVTDDSQSFEDLKEILLDLTKETSLSKDDYIIFSLKIFF